MRSVFHNSRRVGRACNRSHASFAQFVLPLNATAASGSTRRSCCRRRAVPAAVRRPASRTSCGAAIDRRSARIRMPAIAACTDQDGVRENSADQHVQDLTVGHVVPAQRLQRAHLRSAGVHAGDGCVRPGAVRPGRRSAGGAGRPVRSRTSASLGLTRPSSVRARALGAAQAGAHAGVRHIVAHGCRRQPSSSSAVELVRRFRLQASSTSGTPTIAAGQQLAQHQRQLLPAFGRPTASPGRARDRAGARAPSAARRRARCSSQARARRGVARDVFERLRHSGACRARSSSAAVRRWMRSRCSRASPTGAAAAGARSQLLSRPTTGRRRTGTCRAALRRADPGRSCRAPRSCRTARSARAGDCSGGLGRSRASPWAAEVAAQRRGRGRTERRHRREAVDHRHVLEHLAHAVAAAFAMRCVQRTAAGARPPWASAPRAPGCARSRPRRCSAAPAFSVLQPKR